MFESVSEFLTGDERSLAFIFDKDGNAYMPEASQQAIREYIENLPQSNKYVDVNGVQVSFTEVNVGDSIMFCSAGNKCEIVSMNNKSPVYMISYITPKNGNVIFLRCFSKGSFSIVATYFVLSNGKWVRKPNMRDLAFSSSLTYTVDGKTHYSGHHGRRRQG